MNVQPYSRQDALLYAQRWALDRNPKYLSFNELGGDCTNFASQCLYAGSRVMNFNNITGWYYISSYDRAPAWTSVMQFRRFLLNNQGPGPFAQLVQPYEVELGDFIQLSNGNRFYHTLLVVAIEDGMPLVAAHSFDAYMRPLDSYVYEQASGLHILGVYAP